MPKEKNGVIEYRNYYLPYEFPVVLLSGENWRISSVPSKNLHFHNCLEIGVCYSDGGFMAFSGKQPLHFKEGDVTCIPRNIPHTTYSHEHTESRWAYLFFNPEEILKNTMPGMARSFDLSPSGYKDYKYILSKENYPEIYELVTFIIKELEEKKANYQASAFALLTSLTILLCRTQAEGGEITTPSNMPPDNAMVLTPVLDYIEENYASNIDIDYLADICSLSPTHFRRVFNSIMGTSPLDFLNTTRVTKACNLLRSTEDSVLEISEAVGFRSVSSFNRHFMDVMKTTPRNYRNETLQEKQSMDKLSIREYKGWMYPEA